MFQQQMGFGTGPELYGFQASQAGQQYGQLAEQRRRAEAAQRGQQGRPQQMRPSFGAAPGQTQPQPPMDAGYMTPERQSNQDAVSRANQEMMAAMQPRPKQPTPEQAVGEAIFAKSGLIGRPMSPEVPTFDESGQQVGGLPIPQPQPPNQMPPPQHFPIAGGLMPGLAPLPPAARQGQAGPQQQTPVKGTGVQPAPLAEAILQGPPRQHSLTIQSGYHSPAMQVDYQQAPGGDWGAVAARQGSASVGQGGPSVSDPAATTEYLRGASAQRPDYSQPPSLEWIQRRAAELSAGGSFQDFSRARESAYNEWLLGRSQGFRDREFESLDAHRRATAAAQQTQAEAAMEQARAHRDGVGRARSDAQEVRRQQFVSERVEAILATNPNMTRADAEAQAGAEYSRQQQLAPAAPSPSVSTPTGSASQPGGQPTPNDGLTAEQRQAIQQRDAMDLLRPFISGTGSSQSFDATKFIADLAGDPSRRARVAELLPHAVRGGLPGGMTPEKLAQQLGSRLYSDLYSAGLSGSQGQGLLTPSDAPLDAWLADPVYKPSSLGAGGWRINRRPDGSHIVENPSTGQSVPVNWWDRRGLVGDTMWRLGNLATFQGATGDPQKLKREAETAAALLDALMRGPSAPRQ